jgi:hypothetical protein
LDRLAELRESLDRDVQRFERAEAGLGRITASDEAKAIEVVLDRDGAVSKIRVGEAWRRAYEPDGLGTAVMAVYSDAVMARTAAWGEGLAEAQDGPDPVARPAAATPGGFGAAALADSVRDNGAETPITEALAALDAMLDEMIAGIDEVFEIAERRGSAEHEVASSSGGVTATVMGNGTLTTVVFRSGWLRNRHSFNITRELNEAVTAAAARARLMTPANPLAGTPLADLSEAAADPRAMARRLHLND